MVYRTSLSATLVGGLLLIAILSGPGCEAPPSADMDAMTKARLTTQYRKEAENCLAAFTQSNARDFESLECYVEKHRLTTVMHPSPVSCPICYARYGQALGIYGGYFVTLRGKVARKLDRAAPGERAALEAQFKRADAKVKEYFTLSNDVLESYFAAGQGVVPQAYDQASRQYEELKDYNRALLCLNRLVSMTKLSDTDKEKIDRRRSKYQRLLEKQQLDRVKKELDSFDSDEES